MDARMKCRCGRLTVNLGRVCTKCLDKPPPPKKRWACLNARAWPSDWKPVYRLVIE